VSNLELFPSWPLDCIPSIQDGETLFSWCSLYHRISGAISPCATSKRLFGAKTSGFVRDFPARIDQLVHVTGGMLGDADHLIENHTLLRLYGKFRPEETMTRVRTMMRGASVERLKFILGLPSSRANSCHPLKFCRECVADEVNKYGFARWWLTLQCPTVWICVKHNQLLNWVSDRHSGLSRISWFLPSDINESDISSLDTALSSHIAKVAALAKLTNQIADCDHVYYSPDVLRLVFLRAIKDRGFVTSYGKVQYESVKDEFLKHFIELPLIPGMGFVHSLNQNDFGFLGTLIRGQNRSLHPSKYLVMINFLFDDVHAFQSSYDEYSLSLDTEETKKIILDPESICRGNELYKLVVIEGYSLTNAAKTLNISFANVIAWARRNNIEYKRRPRLETEQLLSTMQKLIDKGATREVMATELGVRRQWITEFFGRHPSLRDQWQTQNLIAETQQRREEFKIIIENLQGVPLKELLSVPANGYGWLRKHDRQWLENNLPFLST
jgi:hypothetical protein